MTGKKLALTLSFLSWLSILVMAWLLILGHIESGTDEGSWGFVVFVLIGFVSSVWASKNEFDRF